MGLLKPRTAEKLIFHGDDMERLADLQRAVVRAEAALVLAEDRAEKAARGPRRGGDEIVSAEAEREAFESAQAALRGGVEAASESAVEVRLKALGRPQWRDLLAAHPAREDDDNDAAYGVNVDTFPRALLAYRDENVPTMRTIVSPDASDDDLAEFLDAELSPGDFEELWETAYWLNKAEGVEERLGKLSALTPTSSES